MYSSLVTTEEAAVVEFLKANPETWYGRKEIAKKAVRRRIYEEDPHWCAAALPSLVEQRRIEQNDSGHYRYCKSY